MLRVKLVLKWYWKTGVNSDSKLKGGQSWKYIELELYTSGVNTKINSTLKYIFDVDNINSIPTAVWVVGGAGMCLHSSRVGSIFEMSLALAEPIFKKKLP